jgi:hypothetical protein
MAAGLGFKDFVTGEVLTAADVDGYLMQNIWVFASAAARDAAVTAPAEGNFAYLKDTNVTTYYTGSAWANLDTTGMTNPMTTTGDTIYSSSGSTPARLGIGTAGQVLTVAAGVPSWATPAGSSGPAFQAFSNTAFSAATVTYVKIQLNTETFDTDNCFDSTTNYRFTPTKAGYYQFNSRISIGGMAANAQAYGAIYKNGTAVARVGSGARDTTFNYGVTAGSHLVYLNGSSDYVELYVYVQQAAGTVPINADAIGFETALNGVWIRS